MENREKMKKKFLTILVVGMMLFSLASCDISLLGKWTITEVTAGDVVMSQDDIVEMGIDAGYIILNRSGSCEINLLGDEYEGTWTASEEGATAGNKIKITYGDEQKGKAELKSEKEMVFKDSQGAEYLLVK